jgi:hypothetical protein
MPWNGNQDDPRRRLLIKALAAGLFSSAVCSRVGGAQVLGGRPAQLPPGKSIYRIEGDVLVNGQPATLDTQIAASATIETGKNGEVVYVVGESAFLQRSESHVTLETREADSMIVSGTRHHDRPLYILAGEQSGQNIRAAPFINHTDQELMLIEALVGRSPPFVFPKDNYIGPRRPY